MLAHVAFFFVAAVGESPLAPVIHPSYNSDTHSERASS